MEPAHSTQKESIVGLVVYSPVAYLAIFLLSFLVHLNYPVRITEGASLYLIGVFLIFAAPLLILWAQRTLAAFRAEAAQGTADFHRGPYRFSRNPTYVGLALLTLGFSFISNSLPMLIGTIVSFLVVSFLIVRREEALLHKKYGDQYATYRSKVRRWF